MSFDPVRSAFSSPTHTHKHTAHKHTTHTHTRTAKLHSGLVYFWQAIIQWCWRIMVASAEHTYKLHPYNTRLILSPCWPEFTCRASMARPICAPFQLRGAQVTRLLLHVKRCTLGRVPGRPRAREHEAAKTWRRNMARMGLVGLWPVVASLGQTHRC